MLILFAVILFTCKTMYNKTIIRFGFCDIRSNQGLGKCFQPQLPASADLSVTSTLIIPDIAKTSSNNCFKFSRKSKPCIIICLRFFQDTA